MKLLFDENLSPRLEKELNKQFPDSKHVRNAGLSFALDREIWEYAIANQFLIVSKDADFRQLSIYWGHHQKSYG